MNNNDKTANPKFLIDTNVVFKFIELNKLFDTLKSNNKNVSAKSLYEQIEAQEAKAKSIIDRIIAREVEKNEELAPSDRNRRLSQIKSYNKEDQFKDRLNTYNGYLNKMKKEAEDIGNTVIVEKFKHKKERLDSLKGYLEQMKQVRKVVQLYVDLLKNKVDLHYTTTVKREVVRHKDNLSHRRDETDPLFTKEQIDRVFGQLKYIDTTDKSMQSRKCRLGRQLRQVKIDDATKAVSPTGETSMRESRDLCGVYGDPLIVAESNLLGMNILTLDIKDYISESANSNNYDNKRRQRMQVIHNKNKNCTDALPYSVAEYNSARKDKRNRQIPTPSVKSKFKLLDKKQLEQIAVYGQGME